VSEAAGSGGNTKNATASSTSWTERFGLLTIIVAGVPTGLGIARMYIESHGNRTYFLAWLSAANLLSMWTYVLAAVLLLFIYALPAIVFYYVMRQLEDRRKASQVRRGKLPGRGTIVCAAICAATGLAIFGANTITLIGNPLFILLAGAMLHWRKAELVQPALQGGAIAITLLIVTFSMASSSVNGLPLTTIETSDAVGLRVGYVLAVDDISMTFANTRGDVEYLPSESVKRRSICPGKKLYYSPSLLSYWLDEPSEYNPPSCS
jgi:hypothetical protein